MRVPDTFDFKDPQLYVVGVGNIDCSKETNFALLAPAFRDKSEIVEDAAHAAFRDFKNNVRRANPHSQIFSPLKWTAWNAGYWFWMKHFHASVRTQMAPPPASCPSGSPADKDLATALILLKALMKPGTRLTKLCTNMRGGSDMAIPDPLNGVSRTVSHAHTDCLEFEPVPLDGLRFVRAPAETETRFYWPDAPGPRLIYPAYGVFAGLLPHNQFVVDDQVVCCVYAFDTTRRAPQAEGSKRVIRCPSCKQPLRVPVGANLVATCPTCHVEIDLDSFA